jgi:hypothetical protein
MRAVVRGATPGAVHPRVLIYVGPDEARHAFAGTLIMSAAEAFAVAARINGEDQQHTHSTEGDSTRSCTAMPDPAATSGGPATRS